MNEPLTTQEKALTKRTLRLIFFAVILTFALLIFWAGTAFGFSLVNSFRTPSGVLCTDSAKSTIVYQSEPNRTGRFYIETEDTIDESRIFWDGKDELALDLMQGENKYFVTLTAPSAEGIYTIALPYNEVGRITIIFIVQS